MKKIFIELTLTTPMKRKIINYKLGILNKKNYI